MRLAGRARAGALAIGLIAGMAMLSAAPTPSAAAPRRSGAPISLTHSRTRKVVHYRRRVRHARRVVHARVRQQPARAAQPAEAVAPPAAGTHDGVVTLAAQEANGTDATAASDIQAALSGLGVRVMPILNSDSLATLRDLPNSHVIDLALVRNDVLDAAKLQNKELASQIGYVARLFDEEICLLAGPKVKSIDDLNGKKVGIGVSGSSDWVTARNVFAKLGLTPNFVEEDPSVALAALDKGTLDAVLLVDGKPAPILFEPRARGVHLLAIPYKTALQDQYFPAQLTRADYPRLIAGAPVDTIAVGTVLVAPLQPDDPRRGQRIATFADTFLSHFDALLSAGRHPKWRDVNLAADEPGLTRIASARHWLDMAQAEEEKQFDAYVASRSTPLPKTAAQRDKLFQEFVKWNSTRAQ